MATTRCGTVNYEEFVLEHYLVIAEAAFHVEYYSTLIGAR